MSEKNESARTMTEAELAEAMRKGETPSDYTSTLAEPGTPEYTAYRNEVTLCDAFARLSSQQTDKTRREQSQQLEQRNQLHHDLRQAISDKDLEGAVKAAGDLRSAYWEIDDHVYGAYLTAQMYEAFGETDLARNWYQTAIDAQTGIDFYRQAAKEKLGSL